MKTKPFGYIYEILFPNGKRYLGQTVNLAKRKSAYKNLHCKRQPYVYNALIKYGWEAVVFSILYECNSLEEMNFLEQVSIAQYNTTDRTCGYNLATGGNGGGKASDEKRQNMCVSRIANRDRTVYHFENKNDKQVFTGTQYDFRIQFNINPEKLSTMISGKKYSNGYAILSIKGWTLSN